MRVSTKSISALIMLETRDLHAQVLSVGTGRIHLRVLGELTLRGRVRIAFDRGQMLLGEVIGCGSNGEFTDLALSYVAAWDADSQESLERLLTETLCYPEMRIDHVRERSRGWFYLFNEAEAAAAPPAEDPASKRKHIRVAVRVPVDFVAGDALEVEQGVVYNVSEGGLGLLSEAALPPTGTEFTVYYPLAASTESGFTTLRAVVRWSIDGMSGKGGGIGLEILKVDDGEDGARWRGYVQAESTGGFTLEAKAN